MFTEFFDEVVVFSIDMRVRFRDIELREGMLLRRGDRWSEWSPFLEYSDAEAAVWLQAALETEEPPILRERVPVNATIPVVSPRRAAEIVRSSGCRTAKVKVADPNSCLDDDLARLASVRAALGDDGQLRVDANGAWSVEAAQRSLTAMAAYDLQYVEQPCKTVDELAELRTRLRDAGLDLWIAADESVRRADDPYRVVEIGAADVVVLKNQPLGGWRRCVELATTLGVPVVISSALETSVGIWEGLRTAAALPSLDLACGLNTGRMLSDDVVDRRLRAVDGYLEVGPRPVPSAAALARVRADAHRRAWWHERLNRCFDVAMDQRR